MFFILSKVLGFFALPSDDAAALAALGVILLFTRFKRTGRAFAAVGIIVLLPPALSAARRTPDPNESAERITATVALARQYPQARIIYSGGDARLVIKGG